MLEINDLHAKVGANEIFKGVNLKVKAGEVHAIMRPNGSCKSTLAGVLAGRDVFEVTEGVTAKATVSLSFRGQSYRTGSKKNGISRKKGEEHVFCDH